MGLFSDVDWLIIVAVGAFLLFGRENAQVLRTLGRWYGRALRLKQDLLSEVSRAADLPVAPTGAGGFRSALLGFDPIAAGATGIPAAVSLASTPVRAPLPAVPWTGGDPTVSWSSTGDPGSGLRAGVG